MVTDTVGGREKMETREVTRWLSSARCPATIPPRILPARTVRFPSSFIGSPKVHRVGLPLAMADLNEWRRGCIGLGWMTTTPQISLTRLFLFQAKLLPGPARGDHSGRRQSITTTPRAPAPTQITR